MFEGPGSGRDSSFQMELKLQVVNAIEAVSVAAIPLMVNLPYPESQIPEAGKLPRVSCFILYLARIVAPTPATNGPVPALPPAYFMFIWGHTQGSDR